MAKNQMINNNKSWNKATLQGGDLSLKSSLNALDVSFSKLAGTSWNQFNKN